MDYSGIIKRAWDITWKYKFLWLFGLFAGGVGGGSGTGGGGNGSSGDSSSEAGRKLTQQAENFTDALADNIPLIIAVVGGLVLLGLVLWVISIAARGGLIHLVDEIEQGRQATASEGWSFGFSKWGRLLAIDLLLGLPVVILVVGVGILAAMALIPAFAGGDAGAAGGVVALCGLLVIVIPVFMILGFILSVLAMTSSRYAVLEDRTATNAIGTGWGALRARLKDSVLMWLMNLAINFVFGIVAAVVAIAMMVPGVIMLIAGNIFGFAALAFLMVLVLLLPTAIFNTLLSAAWTIWFRRLTGREAPAQIPVRPVVPGPPSAEWAPAPASPAEWTPVPAPSTEWTPAPTPPAPPAPPGQPY